MSYEERLKGVLDAGLSLGKWINPLALKLWLDLQTKKEDHNEQIRAHQRPLRKIHAVLHELEDGILTVMGEGSQPPEHFSLKIEKVPVRISWSKDAIKAVLEEVMGLTYEEFELVGKQLGVFGESQDKLSIEERVERPLFRFTK